MKKKMLLLKMADMSEETQEKLLEIYRYAASIGVGEVIIFSDGILNKKKGAGNELKRLMGFVPEKDYLQAEIKTRIFLDTRDSYVLCANDFKNALEGRTDIEIVLDCALVVPLGHVNLEFNNFYLDDVNDERVFLNQNIYVFETDGRTEFRKKAAAFGRKIVCVGPFLARESYGSMLLELSRDDSGSILFCCKEIRAEKDAGFQMEKQGAEVKIKME